MSCLKGRSYKRSFLIGCLLGDSHARKMKSGKVEFTIKHGYKQSDLVDYKNKQVCDMLKVTPKAHHKEKYSYFSFTMGKRVRVIQKWFYKDKVKRITDKIRFLDHPVGLAMLLCDDGSVRKRKKTHKDGSVYYLKPRIAIATHCFPKQDVEMFLKHLESKFGIVGFVNPERRRGKEYNRVDFNVLNTQKMWHIVKDFIPDISSMNAKFSYMQQNST